MARSPAARDECGEQNAAERAAAPTSVDSPAGPTRAPDFSADFRQQLFTLFEWRRDVRRFKSDPVSDTALETLLQAANLAPSVGLSQPWRFVMVSDSDRRAAITANFEQANKEALEDYHGEKAKHYARLKLAGLAEAPVHLAVFCDEATLQGHGLGRKTMPEMLRYSVVAAVQNLWLAARSLNVGVGWVSILDPESMNGILNVPEDWSLVAYLCIGYAQEDIQEPELEREGWEERRALGDMLLQR